MVKIVNPSVEIYELTSIDGIAKHIERCGRNCYKSEDAITDESAPKFINGILKSGHESVIEHANLAFTIKKTEHNRNLLLEMFSTVNGLSAMFLPENILISGNMRTFRDVFRRTYNNSFNDYFKKTEGLEVFAISDESMNSDLMLYENSFDGEIELKWIQCPNYPLLFGESYITAKITTDVGSYKDLTRHRLASFSIESTRYCNYNKDKFGSEICVMKPVNIKEGSLEYSIWKDSMEFMERKYMQMASLDGIRADQLRMMLPHSTKADVIMTASINEWKHIFKLRCAKQAHPSVRQCMLMTLELFVERYPNAFEELYEQFKPDIEEFKQLG